ncbi:hypothetical protein GQ53DRAFT_743967 [Thozetella sp. PMI_491]|nr:hypothetical protein GQ53DRAFT_743967 [Thozetella sp. PMI_491]
MTLLPNGAMPASLRLPGWLVRCITCTTCNCLLGAFLSVTTVMVIAQPARLVYT